MFAVNSSEVSRDVLLPPDAPMIAVLFCEYIDPPFRFHPGCLGAGPWLTQSERKYDSSEALILALVSHKNFFCCHHCEKGLFFPIACVSHAETDEPPEAGEEVDEEVEDEEEDIVM